MDILLNVSELLAEILSHCDIQTRSNLALASKDFKIAVESFVYRKIRLHLRSFVPEPDIEAFWDVLDETYAVIGGSFVTNFIFSDLLTDSVNNLNVMVPNGGLPSLMIFFFQLNYDVVHQLPIRPGYTTTTTTIQILENINKVHALIYAL